MRRRWGTVLLVVVSVLGTVVLVDVVFLVARGPVRTLEDFYEPHPQFGYRMQPQAEFLFASPYHGYSAKVRTNSRGLRDDQVIVPKPAGVLRILLLGDSMTAGLEVRKEETFEAVCEQRLRVHGPVEVVNAGVRGYNLDNILLFFENEGASYAPDVVVYLFVENDLKSAAELSPNTLDRSRGFTLSGIAGRLAAYSHLTLRFIYLRQMLRLRRERDRVEGDVRQVNVPHGLYEMLRNPRYAEGPAYRSSAARIATLARTCERSGADFLLAGAPHQPEIDPESQAWWRRYLAGNTPLNFDGVRSYLDWVATLHAIQRFDPVPAFRRAWRSGQTYWFHKDDHLNARGHRLLGEQLAEHIEGMPRFQAWKATLTSSPEASRR